MVVLHNQIGLDPYIQQDEDDAKQNELENAKREVEHLMPILKPAWKTNIATKALNVLDF